MQIIIIYNTEKIYILAPPSIGLFFLPFNTLGLCEETINLSRWMTANIHKKKINN